MKYLVIDERKYDTFAEEFDTKEEATAFADDEWKKLVKADKDSTVAYYILESVNEDEEADDHFDGDIVKEYK